MMGGGGTRLLAAAPEGAEEAEPAAPPARHRSLRTGISGGSPGASVAGAERGRGRRPLRSRTARPPPGSGPPGSASARSHWPSRALREGRCRALIGRGGGARASSRQARPRALLGVVVFPPLLPAGRGGRRGKTRPRWGLAVAAATWRRPRGRAEREGGGGWSEPRCGAAAAGCCGAAPRRPGYPDRLLPLLGAARWRRAGVAPTPRRQVRERRGLSGPHRGGEPGPFPGPAGLVPLGAPSPAPVGPIKVTPGGVGWARQLGAGGERPDLPGGAGSAAGAAPRGPRRLSASPVTRPRCGASPRALVLLLLGVQSGGRWQPGRALAAPVCFCVLVGSRGMGPSRSGS